MAIPRLSPKRGSMLLYVVLLIAAICMMLFTRECSSKRIGPRPDETAGGDTINVAIELSPNGLSLQGDTLSGEYYLMLRELFGSHGRPVKFHPYTRLEDALDWLREGKCRLVVGDIPVTADMRKNLIFVDHVGLDRQVLVQLLDSVSPDSAATATADGATPATDRRAIRNQFDLAGKRVHVAKSSPYVERLRNLSREIGDTIYIVEDSDYSAEQLVILTAVGEIPYAVVAKSIASRIAKQYPRLDHSVAISLNQFQSWALAPRDSMLRDTLNLWLESR